MSLPVPVWHGGGSVLFHGDCLDVLREMPDAIFDAVVTDPPYELGFMGRAWDASGIAYNVDLWKHCLRVLKPGGHLLAFGGTRTYHRLACAVEDAGFEIRDSISWIYGSGFPKSLDVSKAIDKAAGAEREIVGTKASNRPNVIGLAPGNSMGGGAYTERLDTAPATDDAKRWEGWGTALKPSHEPVVCAMKPYTLQQILDAIGSRLDGLEQAWQALEADRITQTGAAAGSGARTATWPFASGEPTSSSIVSSWRSCWAEICSRSSTSTTSTTSSMTTDLKTLCSLLEQITRASTTADQMTADGLSSLVVAADNLFAAALLSSRATLALSVTEIATASTPTSRQGEAGSTAHEPIVVARKPLIGTVAQNILTHGTGGLNIDACRVDLKGERPPTGSGDQRSRAIYAQDEWSRTQFFNGGNTTHDAGRWPTNVVLDETMAEQLDEQSGTSVSKKSSRGDGIGVGYHGSEAAWDTERGFNDSGGASRFFPVFRYQAKAPTRERPKVDGVSHPTVKPLDLMRWLVRLVTPPGGIVLEPFAGSGTTMQACQLEGMRCAGIERDATYLPLIVSRLSPDA